MDSIPKQLLEKLRELANLVSPKNNDENIREGVGVSSLWWELGRTVEVWKIAQNCTTPAYTSELYLCSTCCWAKSYWHLLWFKHSQKDAILGLCWWHIMICYVSQSLQQCCADFSSDMVCSCMLSWLTSLQFARLLHIIGLPSTVRWRGANILLPLTLPYVDRFSKNSSKFVTFIIINDPTTVVKHFDTFLTNSWHSNWPGFFAVAFIFIVVFSFGWTSLLSR